MGMCGGGGVEGEVGWSGCKEGGCTPGAEPYEVHK